MRTSIAAANLRWSAFAGVACAVLAVTSTPAAPESPSQWSIACTLDVSMSIKDQVATAVRQRLRALGDVTVGGADSGCEIGIVGLALEESSAAGILGQHTRRSFGVLVSHQHGRGVAARL
jgi:hypothetical protein